MTQKELGASNLYMMGGTFNARNMAEHALGAINHARKKRDAVMLFSLLNNNNNTGQGYCRIDMFDSRSQH